MEALQSVSYLKKPREDIRRLASDHKQAWVEFSEVAVQVLQRLQQKPRKQDKRGRGKMKIQHRANYNTVINLLNVAKAVGFMLIHEYNTHTSCFSAKLDAKALRFSLI